MNRYPRSRPITKGSLPHRFWQYLKERELRDTLDLEGLSGLDVHVLTQTFRVSIDGQQRPYSEAEERDCLRVAAHVKHGNWVAVER